MARCLLFDLGNVLLDFDHRTVSRRLAAHASPGRPVTAGELHDYIFGGTAPSSPNAQIDRGTLTLESLYRDVVARFSLTLPFDAFRDAWTSIFAAQLNHPVMERVAELTARGAEVWICSNTNDEHWSWLRARHQELAALDQAGRCLLSYRVGLVKTDPGFFARAAATTGFQATAHLLIDDREDNCRAAEAAGMHAFHYAAPVDGLDAYLRRDHWLPAAR